jgi:hypothetical protein
MKDYKFLVCAVNASTIVELSAESLLSAYCSILEWANSNPFKGINYNSMELIKDGRKPLIIITA